MRFFITLIISLWAVQSTHAQSRTTQTRFVWEGGTSLNYKISNSWSFNTSIGKRSVWSTAETNGDEQFEGHLSFLEVDHFSTYQINPATKASLGYKYRWRDPSEGLGEYEHRITQQVAYTHFKEVIRMVSRLRLEQRIRNESFAMRYRYRLSADMPLSGETLDAREFYLVGSNEILFEAVDVEEDTWEMRTSGSIGYLLNPDLKVELSLTYRMENLTRSIEDFLFINTGVFINLK